VARLAAVLAAIGERNAPSDRRTAWDRFTGAFPLPAGVDVEPAAVGGVPAETFTPDAAGASTVLWFHGGG